MTTPLTTKALRLLAALAAVTALGSCGDGGDDDEASTDSSATADAGGAEGGDHVDVENFEFEPADLTVAAGTTVRWTNGDDAIHSIKGDGDLEYESADLSQGDTFEQTFDDPGEQPYVCGKHSYMKGTVTVE